MKRAQRLYALVQTLKDGNLHRAEDLAEDLNVSVRTIYRDMDTLVVSGVPVEGERGLGYSARAAITLPPLNLTVNELEALHLGLAAIGYSMDEEMKTAAESLSAKIDAVLPEDETAAPKSFGFAVYPFADAAEAFQHLPSLRSAIRARQRLKLTFADQSVQEVRPLKLDYWGRVWTLVAWCETTDQFESLRVDQIKTVSILPGLFVEEEGKRLSDYSSLGSLPRAGRR
ncbi:HTH domain-containing protein [Cognatishimia sp. WU-CL00825]|uniref:helix-turn-helix transcriptional regulator n=1 Tax=Cognatishimia sp. WU-CL00825 TaxID=3127658 RepID=UPI003104B3B9